MHGFAPVRMIAVEGKRDPVAIPAHATQRYLAAVRSGAFNQHKIAMRGRRARGRHIDAQNRIAVARNAIYKLPFDDERELPRRRMAGQMREPRIFANTLGRPTKRPPIRDQ